MITHYSVRNLQLVTRKQHRGPNRLPPKRGGICVFFQPIALVVMSMGVPRLKVSGFQLIWTILALSIILFPLCFALFYALNSDGIVYIRGIPQLPTLSLTGGYWPELGVFTTLLHLFAFLSFFIFSMISEVLQEKLDSSNDCLLDRWKFRRTEFQRINSCLYWIGISFAIAIFITGSIPVTIAPISHAIFAILMFVLGCAHIIIYTFSYGLGVFHGVCQNYWHLTAFILVVPVNVAALVASFVARATCSEQECIEFSIQMVVIVEYITALGLLLYVSGFMEMVELKDTFLTIALAQLVVEGEMVHVGDGSEEMQTMGQQL